jgi:hypothetical protein
MSLPETCFLKSSMYSEGIRLVALGSFEILPAARGMLAPLRKPVALSCNGRRGGFIGPGSGDVVVLQ